MSDIYANHQTLFDHIISNLIKQGKPSLAHVFMNGRRDLSCAYRGDGDCRCAAGWALPDEYYTKGIEGCQISDVIRSKGIKVLRPFMAMLSQLQDAHDMAWAPDRSDAIWLGEFKRRAAVIATEFNLRWNHG